MSAQPNDTPVLDLLASMTASSIEATSLDAEQLMLVRIAALVAVDAPPISYMLNLGVAADADVDAEQVQGVLAAVAPIVGTARVASAAGKLVEALGIALDVAELEDSTSVGSSLPTTGLGDYRWHAATQARGFTCGRAPSAERSRAPLLTSHAPTAGDTLYARL